FKPLTKDNISSIIDLLMRELNERLAEKEVMIKLTTEAEDFIVDNAYDPVYGARPLKRYLQKTVETLSAKMILSGNVGAGDTIVIDVLNGELKAQIEECPQLA
ncbi:MAG: type VI secretion system ATPase TssH, partial [Lachnospiraceae bacterium]|nr:type VI secretion system ATPase TssH [Lachnospiraceae bacterium]